jgi:hypothetical protein
MNFEDAYRRAPDEMQYIRTDPDMSRPHHDVFMWHFNTPQPHLGFISEKYSALLFVDFRTVELQSAVANFVESTLFQTDCDSGTGYSVSGDSCNENDTPLHIEDVFLLPPFSVSRAHSMISAL